MKVILIAVISIFLTACNSSTSNPVSLEESMMAADTTVLADVENSADTSIPAGAETSVDSDLTVNADPPDLHNMPEDSDTFVDTDMSEAIDTPEDNDTLVNNDTSETIDRSGSIDTPENASTPADTETSVDDNTQTPELEYPVDELLITLAFYQSEELAEKVLRISELIESNEDNRIVITDNLVDVDETKTTTTNKVSYSCSAGGQIIFETKISENRNVNFSSSDDISSYTFEQCAMAISDESLVDGDYSVNGTFTLRTIDFSGRANSSQITREWRDFSLNEPGDNSLSIDGQTADTTENDGDRRITRAVEINRYNLLAGDQLLLNLNNVSVELISGTQNSGYINFYQFNANGELRGTQTQSEFYIKVSTDPIFVHRTTAQPEVDPATFTGGMLVTTFDTELAITALQVSSNDRLISYTYTSATGDTVNVDEHPFIDLFTFAPEN